MLMLSFSAGRRELLLAQKIWYTGFNAEQA